MSRTLDKRIGDWLCGYAHYGHSSFGPDISAGHDSMIVDVDADTLTIEWDEQSDTMLGQTTRRVSVPLTVVRQLLEWRNKADRGEDP